MLVDNFHLLIHLMAISVKEGISPLFSFEKYA